MSLFECRLRLHTRERLIRSVPEMLNGQNEKQETIIQQVMLLSCECVWIGLKIKPHHSE